jgi:hypothetical protein
MKDRMIVNTRIPHLLVFGRSNFKRKARSESYSDDDMRLAEETKQILVLFIFNTICSPCHPMFSVGLSASSAIIFSDQKLTTGINSVLFIPILLV